MYKFRMYIPYACNIDALNRAIDSVVYQMDHYSSWEGKKVVVINDSEQSIDTLIHHPDKVEIYESPYRIKMNHAYQCNWMVRDALYTGQDFCMSLHADAELLPGAMDDMLEKITEIWETKWGIVFAGHGGHIFSVSNPKFFIEENVWFDPFLFPFYYMDNHIFRIMNLRGWQTPTTNSDKQLVLHKSSHYLKEDPIFRRKNEIAFPAHGMIYAAIWGGLPGNERSNDKYANGTIPRK